MIAVEGLTARYGRRTVLDRFELAVAKGEVFALLGRNGAGKSTLFRILLGQRRADAGSVAVLGRDPWRERAALAATIGATPESPDAPPATRLRDLVDTEAALRHPFDRRELAERMERFGLAPDAPFGQLSRGQKALFLLAIALAHRPELLLLDDPTLGLDPVARRWAFEEVVDELAANGTTVLLATHDADAAARVATHAGILHGTRLAASGPVDALRGEGSLEEVLVAISGTPAAKSGSAS